MIINGYTVIECTQFLLNETEVTSSQDFNIIINQSLGIKNEYLPNSIILYDNYPNPFNRNTSIKYSQKNNDSVNIYITDIKGYLVKNLHEVKQSKRGGIVSWDGTNNLGLKMVSGMYFYTLKTKNYITTKKMLLLK